MRASADTAASLCRCPPVLPLSLRPRPCRLSTHLADKILANRGRLAGERKLVTVLFADIAGYTALSTQVGEEALFVLMDELAARIEQTATPGTAQLTEHTYQLVAGYFDCDDLGPTSVKGVAERVRAYRVNRTEAAAYALRNGLLAE